ncbi:MAG: ATP phosphoribosyltransferase regulatory subunit [Clostridia bacterium]|nr:ATP phosphoribosyltransferase regulatory subunit [Clostridia bacterium]
MSVTNEIMLNRDERIIYALRSLYKNSGYTQFKMSKFEEYDLYGKNKDFLISDGVITFTDASGKLMALKPDVTFSIIKNSVDIPGYVKRVCYNENVYRMSEGTHDFTEIMQSGVECIGELDIYNIYEVLSLAEKSLEIIADEYVLDVSHLGFVDGLIKDAGDCDTDAVLKCIGEKNAHGLGELLDGRADKLKRLVGLYGGFEEIIPELESLNVNDVTDAALCDIKALARYLGDGEHIKLDFSVVSSMNYYNGIVFKGFVSGVPAAVLSGGRYDKLMKKLGKHSGAVGFAVYHDRLKYLEREVSNVKKPVLVLYSADTDTDKIIAEKNRLISEGASFDLQKTVADEGMYSRIIDIRAKG